MADPTTGNVELAQPLRGADSGQWDTPLNSNFGAIDTLFGGQVTLTINAATTLTPTVPATGTVSPSANTVQSWNAAFKLSGTLTGGNSTIALTLPRRYIIDATGLTTGTSCVVLAPASGTGTRCGVPWGRVSDFWFDGTNVKFLGLEQVGCYVDMAVATTPSWITQSSVPPYVLTDGSTYSTSVYPALGNMLGSTFGGNGITTFGTPDLRNRYRIPLDTNPGSGFANRVTAAVSGINGQALGAAGGDQNMPTHTHGITDPGHIHPVTNATGPNSPSSLVSGSNNLTQTSGPQGSATTGITINSAGTGVSGNVPPGIVAGLSFIKT